MSTVERRRAPRVAEVRAPRLSSWWSSHPLSVQVVTGLALVLGIAYLTWRVGWSGRGANPLLFVTLLVAEIFGWVSFACYAFLAWTARTTRRPEPLVGPSVDIFVCTYDEPVSVVESTLIGCRAIPEPHVTYLLDDGRRSEMAELAARLGARYLTRADNSHAKAGNINHALGMTSGELILMLDADHVPLPHILESTTGYFADPGVALVQSPHDFSNRDSMQHTTPERHEQSLFYDVIAPGKDRHNAMFWCGSATLVRRSALVEVGGVLTETVAEDFHTTIAMHARGWRTRYHHETLVQGRAPHDLAGFLLQRARWARGNLGVFRTRENPVTCRGLSPKQRASYLSSLLNYFSGIQRLTLLAVLIATLVSGALPMRASIVVLAALWLPWSITAFTSTIALARGTLGPMDSSRYGLLTMGINMRAVAALLRKRTGTFKVTPKEGIDEGGLRVLRMLVLVSGVALVLVASWIARWFDVLGVVELPDLPAFVTGVVLVLGAWELFCIGCALIPVVRRRQLRSRFRVPTEMTARIAGTTIRVDVTDLTSDGLAFELPFAYPIGRELRLLTRIPDASGALCELEVPIEVRSCSERNDDSLHRIGCRILELEAPTREALVEFCDIVLAAQRLGAMRGSGEIELPLPEVPVGSVVPPESRSDAG